MFKQDFFFFIENIENVFYFNFDKLHVSNHFNK